MEQVLSLKDVITCAINKIEVGETKKEAVQEITSYVENNYINKAMIQDLINLPLDDVAILHQEGFDFGVNGGELNGIVLKKEGQNNGEKTY